MSIGDLVEQLHRQAWAFTGPPGDSVADLQAWRPLAVGAARTFVALGVAAELRADLVTLAASLPPGGSAGSSLVSMGETMGALADVLVTHPGALDAASAAARERLAVSVQAVLHVVAQRTPSLDSSAQSEVALQRIKAATEAAAQVPPQGRSTPLMGLSVLPRPGTAEAAVTAWAREAHAVLTSPLHVTGYSLQRTAVDVALICRTVARAGAMPPGVALELGGASQQWRAAAAWPDHVRLGGRTRNLRLASENLHSLLLEGFGSEDPAVLRRTLDAAQGVAAEHGAALRSLAAGRRLWVAVASLPDSYLDQHPGTRRSGWVMEPPTSQASHHLAQASATAYAALSAAVTSVDLAMEGQPHAVTPPAARRPTEWETVAPVRTTRRTSPPAMVHAAPMLPGLGI